MRTTCVHKTMPHIHIHTHVGISKFRQNLLHSRDIIEFFPYLQRVDMEVVWHAIGNYMYVRQMLSRHG